MEQMNKYPRVSDEEINHWLKTTGVYENPISSMKLSVYLDLQDARKIIADLEATAQKQIEVTEEMLNAYENACDSFYDSDITADGLRRLRKAGLVAALSAMQGDIGSSKNFDEAFVRQSLITEETRDA